MRKESRPAVIWWRSAGLRAVEVEEEADMVMGNGVGGGWLEREEGRQGRTEARRTDGPSRGLGVHGRVSTVLNHHDLANQQSTTAKRLSKESQTSGPHTRKAQ